MCIKYIDRRLLVLLKKTIENENNLFNISISYNITFITLCISTQKSDYIDT